MNFDVKSDTDKCQKRLWVLEQEQNSQAFIAD
jgi:hypothetical protein